MRLVDFPTMRKMLAKISTKNSVSFNWKILLKYCVTFRAKRKFNGIINIWCYDQETIKIKANSNEITYYSPLFLFASLNMKAVKQE